MYVSHIFTIPLECVLQDSALPQQVTGENRKLPLAATFSTIVIFIVIFNMITAAVVDILYPTDS